MSDGLRDAIAKCCVTAVHGGAIPMEDLGAFAQNLDETVRAWLAERIQAGDEIIVAARSVLSDPPKGDESMTSDAEDAFNRLDLAMTDAIEVGMTVDQAREIVECVLGLREIRARFDAALVTVDPPKEPNTTT